MSRENKSFPERLKHWIQSGGVRVVQENTIKVTEELKADLDKSSPLGKRLSAVGVLTELLKTAKLEKVRLQAGANGGW